MAKEAAVESGAPSDVPAIPSFEEQDAGTYHVGIPPTPSPSPTPTGIVADDSAEVHNRRLATHAYLHILEGMAEEAALESGAPSDVPAIPSFEEQDMGTYHVGIPPTPSPSPTPAGIVADDTAEGHNRRLMHGVYLDVLEGMAKEAAV